MEFSTISGILSVVLKPIWEKGISDLKGKDIRTALKRIFIKAEEHDKFEEIADKPKLDDNDIKLVQSVLNTPTIQLNENEIKTWESILNIDASNRDVIVRQYKTIETFRKRLEELQLNIISIPHNSGEWSVQKREVERFLKIEIDSMRDKLGLL